MAPAYQHDGPNKFALAGLDLNVPVDLVPPGKYSRATNVVSKIEGRLETRDGAALIAQILPNTPIHTVFRLSQAIPSIAGERLVAAGSSLFTAPIPDGSVFTQLTGFPYDGGPLSIIEFRFDADPAPWAIIANSSGMTKRRAGYYFQLGVPAPTVAATASDGGVGTLNSSVTGIGYDWRYTYLNTVTLSESAPSPTLLSGGGTTTVRPSSAANPATGVGGDPYANPNNAFDGNPVTFAQSFEDSAGSGNLQTGSCLWQGVGAVSGIVLTAVLYVDSSVAVFHTGSSGGARALIQYSTDNGVTWNLLYSVGGNRTRQVNSVNLPAGINTTQVLVRGETSANAFTDTSEISVTHNVYEISIVVTLQAGVTPTLALTNRSANVCITPPTDPQETVARLYRRGGTLPNDWYFVGQFVIASLIQGPCGTGTLVINDNVADAQAQIGVPLIGSAIDDHFMPVPSVQAFNQAVPVVFGPYDERALACGDPNRPESVYFSDRGNADIWRAENWVVVADPGEQTMNGIVYGLRCFVWSREQLYLMVPNIIAGQTFTPAKTACRRGLKGRWFFTKGEKGMYFGSKDGIYRTSGGPEESIIDDSIRPLFPTRESPAGRPTNGYDAVDMSDENGLRLAFHNGEIWFYYTGLTTGKRQLLIFDERRDRWRAGSYTPVVQMAYSEPNTTSSLVYGGTDGSLYAAGGLDDAGQPIPVEFTTGANDQGRPLNLKEYGNVVFDVDPGGATNTSPVMIVPRINGETIAEAALKITGTGRQRVPLPLQTLLNDEVFAYNLEFDVTWTASASFEPILYHMETFFRHEPAEVTHWQLPPTSFGAQGWMHVRDIYLMIRSNADVTLTLTPSIGPVITATIPATAGKKLKQYIQLLANKGKTYGIQLDSTVPFRIYSDESEVRVKQWLTKLGYTNIPIIGAEQVGRPFGVTNV